jgi:hypothetical protein
MTLMASGLSHAGETAVKVPMISIIIDDMGYRLVDGLQALSLPGPVTYSFLPHTPNIDRLTDIANQQGSEILVHLPMEAEHHNQLLGPGALRSSMSYDDFLKTFHDSVLSIPHAIGINNHMGSQLTTQNKHMQWLMQAVKKDGKMFFVDSRTTAKTIAGKVAHENGVATATRDVFLDHDPREALVRQQLEQLIRKARHDGTAIAIGHPLPDTLRVLHEILPELEKKHGVKLVPITELMNRREEEARQWRVSSSR